MTSTPATVADTRASLSEWMDITYGKDAWSFRGDIDTGSDAGAAINNALRALTARYYKGGTVFVEPSAVFQLQTDIDHALLSGNTIEGAGEEASNLCFGSGTTRGLWFSGILGRTGGGLKNIQLHIEANAGDSIKGPILLQGDEHFQPDDVHIENVRCTSMDPTKAFWYTGLHYNGIARDPTKPGASSLQGIRRGVIRNLQLFCCRNVGAIFHNAVSIDVEQLGIYVPKPDTLGGSIYIGGGGTWGTNTTQLYLDAECGGDLVLTNSTFLRNMSVKCGRVIAAPSCDFISGEVFANEPLIGQLGPHSANFRVTST
jgi:hypothetical protein